MPLNTNAVVITGASAGVGRAAAREFAAHGRNVALLARNARRLESVVRECSSHGVRALAIATDVADAAAVEAAASRIEQELGPIDVWVNSAMATVFAPLANVTAEEFERGTRVTYLGQVYGTMAALRRMRPRDRGTIVNVGSALAFRAIPLQSIYCGAKFAVRGFTESLRSEIIHDRLNIHLCMVHLPAMNTPQFDWALNKTGKKARPMGAIFEPEVGAQAIFFAATHPRRDIWVGMPTAKAILANRIAPGWLDHYLAHKGYEGQLTDEATAAGMPANLFQSVDGAYGARGRFDAEAKKSGAAMLTDRQRNAFWTGAGVTLLGALGLFALRRAPRAARAFRAGNG